MRKRTDVIVGMNRLQLITECENRFVRTAADVHICEMIGVSDVPTSVYERMVYLVEKCSQILSRPKEIRIPVLSDVFYKQFYTRFLR